MVNPTTYEDLHRELLSTQSRLLDAYEQLNEAKEVISAIRLGEVDALVVNAGDGHQLYTLKTADETYRIFIEQMNEGAVTLNEHSCIMYSNSRFAELLDIPLNKIFGVSFYHFLPHQDRESMQRTLQEAWQSTVKTECRLQSTLGSSIPVSLSMKVLALDEGPALSIIITDQTAQKRAQAALEQKNSELENARHALHLANLNLEAMVRERTEDLLQTIEEKERIERNLRQNEQRLSDILETMAEGVCIVNRQGNLEYANAMAQKLLTFSEQNEGLNLYTNDLWENTLVNGLPLSREVHPMYLSMTTAKPIYDYEIGIRRTGKELMYISMNATPVYDGQGRLAGSLGTFTDVTNRRIILQQKDDFINVASHELKTPVTALNGYLQLLEGTKSQIPQNVQYLIDKAGQSMSRVVKLIHELLDNSKIAGGQLSVQKSEFVLGEVVAECVQYIYGLDAHKVVVTGDIEEKVIGDAVRIGQVVGNFLSNAFKYAPGSPQIVVAVKKLENGIKLTVTDFGPGIEEAKIPNLFDKYYRAHSNNTQFSLGLGLYICAEIIKKHDGKIGVESSKGNGSSFWFILPC